MTNESERNANKLHNTAQVTAGSSMVQFVSQKTYEAAKKAKENIKHASSSATSMVEKTTGVKLHKRVSIEDNLEKKKGDDCPSPSASTKPEQSTTSVPQSVSSVRNSPIEHISTISASSSSVMDEVRIAGQVKLDSQERQPKTPVSKNMTSFSFDTLKDSLIKIEDFKAIKVENLKAEHLIQNPSVVMALLAMLLSASSYAKLWENQVQVHVALAWVALGLALGVEIGRRQSAKEIREYLSLQSTVSMRATTTQVNDHEANKDDRSLVAPGVDKESGLKSISRVRKMMDKLHNHIHDYTWTTLDRTRQRQQWEWGGKALVSRPLTMALRDKTPSSCRKSLARIGVSEQELLAAEVEDESLFVLSGAISDPERMRARSLEDEAVEPLCRLRGLDVFLTDQPEANLASHSFLIQHGLRDRPTFIINIQTQWGNVAIYFEMPEWIKSWDEFEESEDDLEEVIALKRFLNKDDEYRNNRFKCLPVLIDGPGPIRYMAPPRSTVTVVSPSLPSVWKKHPASLDENGKTLLHPCLELECDLTADRAMRTTSALVKRFLNYIVGDVAILIEKPYLQKEEEPRACLGMCRFDRIDIGQCPEMPLRKEEGDSLEQRDFMRLSVMVGRPVTLQECIQPPPLQTHYE